MRKFKKYWNLGIALLFAPAIVCAVYTYQRFLVDGTEIYELQSDGSLELAGGIQVDDYAIIDGPIKQGDSGTGASATLPTTTTGSNFSKWVPVYNVGAAVIRGEILISSNTGTGYVRGGPATTDLTSVVGVAAEAIASGAKGWMVPRGAGYAIVLASGAVSIGDILVSSASWAGYAGVDNTPTDGAEIARAMSAKSTGSGAGVLAIMD